MKLRSFGQSRLLVLIALVVGLALATTRVARAYVVWSCIGGDLYGDIYDDNGGYHGYIRQHHPPQCN